MSLAGGSPSRGGLRRRVSHRTTIAELYNSAILEPRSCAGLRSCQQDPGGTMGAAPPAREKCHHGRKTEQDCEHEQEQDLIGDRATPRSGVMPEWREDKAWAARLRAKDAEPTA